MKKQQITRKDYTTWGTSYQLVLPLNFEFQIPKNLKQAPAVPFGTVAMTKIIALDTLLNIRVDGACFPTQEHGKIIPRSDMVTADRAFQIREEVRNRVPRRNRVILR